MTTYTGSFTDVNTASSYLYVTDIGETVSVALSGTYAMTIKLQRAVTSDASAWETIQTWSTANATVAFDYVTDRRNEVFRLFVYADTSGTAVYSIGDGDKETRVLRDNAGNVQATFTQAGVTFPGTVTISGTLTPSAAFSPGLVTVTGTSLTVTAAAHAGKVVVLNRAAGIAVTLPAATGTGNVYKFFVKTTFTGAATIKSVASADIMIGHALMGNDSDNTVVLFQTVAADTNDTIDLFGTANSTGGIEGQTIELIDVATNRWAVQIVGDAAGTEATPFANTVS